MMETFDAILVVSFGGPEGPEDVMPFLRNVVRGKNVPDERLKAVAHHYDLFGGISPINRQNREFIDALAVELKKHRIDLPIYWGNRNWHPLLEDTLAVMAASNIRKVLAFATSAYSSYSGCRQYLEDIERARQALGSGAPVVEKIKPFYNCRGFLDANEARLREALASFDDSAEKPHIAFCAHSIPLSMAQRCRYEAQLLSVASELAHRVGAKDWKLTFQSRSGPPTVPWLEPDVNDHLKELSRTGYRNVILAPIGFVSDHMEVVYDLDTEASQLARDLGMKLIRSATVGVHHDYVSMVRVLIEEHLGLTGGTSSSPSAHVLPLCTSGGAAEDLCGTDCCTFLQ